MKLLIVDDNTGMRSMLRGICNEMFAEINECKDGDEAVEAYDVQKPDWVLMDIKMKKMDGITATKKIKIKYPGAKIIIVSQYNDKNFIEESIKSGAMEFVSKEDLTRVEEIIKTNF